ncbi:ribosomal protein L10-domain-containing protein [Pseudomassariella vexata]|uniref:Ribosome assembly factor mrt4 n=1 Tax=Pseudomassariella vexata TaxID=1141098 RepID=A0A1Y2DWS5_9PEZI|nr:ribosomal protein L10-domain-containing protein [Pseudomassariella vexata]ORY63554.1 ribosomal protein L10-domain-containing protein [Pseudomassariella vexata]
MPKSKRSKVVHLTQVSKKTREDKNRLFENVRDAVPEYQHIVVFAVENMRNTYLKDVRKELSDSRIFLGKTTVMSRALGRTPEEETAENLHKLNPYVTGGVGLLMTNRQPSEVIEYLSSLSEADFARAGTVATRDFIIPSGPVYSTGGEIPAEHDVPMGHTIEPELRKLNVPTRMVKGKVVLGEEDGSSEGYRVCKEGEVLDSRQTRLLKLFSVCMSDFTIKVRAYWTAATGEVTVVDADAES